MRRYLDCRLDGRPCRALVDMRSTISLEVEHEFWLADIHDPCIIGLDLLIRWGARVDVSRAAITLGVETVALQSGPGKDMGPGDVDCRLIQPAIHTGSVRPTRRRFGPGQMSGDGGQGPRCPSPAIPGGGPDEGGQRPHPPGSGMGILSRPEEDCTATGGPRGLPVSAGSLDTCGTMC
ncbi:unnamed protein product [Lota lota]